MKIVVTGAAGLLGAHLLPVLAEHEVHALSRTPLEGAGPHVVPHSFDLEQRPDWDALPLDIDAVIYLAQSPHFRLFPERAADVFAVNAGEVVRAVDYARRAGAKRFIFTSTGGVYRPSPAPLREEDPTGSTGELGFYVTTKLCAESVLMDYAKHLDVTILRPFFIYGAGQKRDMLMPRLADRIRKGEPVMLQGEDGLAANPVHASDAAQAVAAALGLSGSHVVNVAGPEVLSLRAIAETIGQRLGVAPRFESAGGTAPSSVADIARMTSLLWEPRARFAERVGEIL